MTTIVGENSDDMCPDEGPGEAVRYLAPELIENGNLCATMSSDTYSFAMLILECITERIPFSELSYNAAVVHTRINEMWSPFRPDCWALSDDLWDLMQHCWSYAPEDRPTMERVHSFLPHV